MKRLANSTIPVAAGFGISKPEHVSRLIHAGADGAIVGSALVKIVNENLNSPEKPRGKLIEAVSGLKAATKGGTD